MGNSKKKNKTFRKNKVIETKADWILALRESKRNLELIDKPRKKINTSFIAKCNSGECPKCLFTIQEGDKVRYNDEGVLVHVRHEIPEPKYTFCDRCFLSLPCECDA